MQCCLLSVGSFLCISVVLSVGSPTRIRGDSLATQQYCNEQYRYCVTLPNVGKAELHEGDAPNHGVTIDLAAKQDLLWTYAAWDAALLEGSRKAALQRREIILREHHDAKIDVAPTKLGGLSAFHIRATYGGIKPMNEEIVIAYRKPKDKSKGTGIIYEIGLECVQSARASYVGIFKSFISAFRLQ